MRALFNLVVGEETSKGQKAQYCCTFLAPLPFLAPAAAPYYQYIGQPQPAALQPEIIRRTKKQSKKMTGRFMAARYGTAHINEGDGARVQRKF
jgi:hypothetical protein